MMRELRDVQREAMVRHRFELEREAITGMVLADDFPFAFGMRKLDGGWNAKANVGRLEHEAGLRSSWPVRERITGHARDLERDVAAERTFRDDDLRAFTTKDSAESADGPLPRIALGNG